MKTLLLNSTYEPMRFITVRKALLFCIKGKVDILTSWDHTLRWGSGKMCVPSVIRLRYFVKWVPRRSRFNKITLFRRDKWSCQYCGKKGNKNDLTVDHVIPSSKGGKKSWLNCVSSCFSCNNKKGNKTPIEARMPLINNPKVPIISLKHEAEEIRPYHKSWDDYLW